MNGYKGAIYDRLFDYAVIYFGDRHCGGFAFKRLRGGRMDCKEYLKQIKKLETLIRNKGIEVKKAEKLGINTATIKSDIERLVAERARIIENIQRLSEAEYDVLHKVYVQGKTLYEVADERDISYSMATTIHGRALKHLAVIIADPVERFIKDCM